MVSLFCLARARSSLACSSVYFGVAVGVAAAIGELVLALALALAPGPVFSHATAPKPKAAIAVSTINLLFIFWLFPFLSDTQKRIASFTVSWRFSLRGLQQPRRLSFGLFLLFLVPFLQTALDSHPPPLPAPHPL